MLFRVVDAICQPQNEADRAQDKQTQDVCIISTKTSFMIYS